MAVRRIRSTICVFLLALGLGACGNPGNSAGVQAESESFWTLITRIAVDFQYHDTLEALWNDSDAAVIGYMENVREGRGLGGKKGGDVATETVIITFHVEELVRGDLNLDSQRIVDLEVRRPSLVSVRELDDATPPDRMLLLIYDQAGTMPNVVIDETGADGDPGKTLYALTTYKGLFIEHSDGLVTPLNRTPGPFESSFEATTLDELAEEIRSF